MCGFVAIIGRRPGTVDVDLLRRMNRAIAHRGPDDQGEWTDGRVGLGFRRLAILDLSPAGHQPMVSDDGRFVLVFNGEIYNFAELRGELESLGHRFHSTGDSEVLLHAYMQWGADCVGRLNGMWAFVVYDQSSGVVFGSRDRFGIKPLYRATRDGRTLLGSEIKALRAAGAGADADWSRVADWLGLGRVDGTAARGRTFFDGIVEVPPATAFQVAPDGTWREWTFWSLEGIERREHPDPTGAFAELFEDAVRLQARADVPVGVSLSGGLDSTAIICALTRARGGADPVTAYCFFSDEHDEREYIDATLRYTGARLEPVRVSARGLFDVLDDVIRVHDEPLHSLTAVIGYEIMRAARAGGVKVMLGGQGADETLAGYPNYFDELRASLVRRGEHARAAAMTAAWVETHGGAADALLAQAARRARRQTWEARIPGYRAAAQWKRRRGFRRHAWFTPEVMRPLAMDYPPPPDGLSDVLLASVRDYPLPTYLRIDDRNSMAHGVEARVPFLDHRLVELAFALPEEWLLHGPWNKYVLRTALQGRAPDVVAWRPDKMGFPHPARRWFASDLAEPVADILASSAFATRGIYDVARVRRDFERHRAGAIDCSRDLFTVVQFERWAAEALHATPDAPREPVTIARAALAGS